jgi:hypothetical protein
MGMDLNLMLQEHALRDIILWSLSEQDRTEACNYHVTTSSWRMRVTACNHHSWEATGATAQEFQFRSHRPSDD